MNLLNIPKSYILTNEEICELDILINQALKEDRYRPYYYTALREIQRKLNLLDSVFRASEEPDNWTPKYPYLIEMDKCLACGGELSSPSEGRIGCPLCDYSTPVISK